MRIGRRVRHRWGIAAALLACSGGALADLYRWVDPETGSTKFSSYPPPWFGDPARERRAPKVEVIPGTAPPAAAAPSAAATEQLEARRLAMLQQLPAIAAQAGTDRGAQLARFLAEYRALGAQLDRADPAGAALRSAELEALVRRLTPPPAAGTPPAAAPAPTPASAPASAPPATAQ